MIPYEQLCEALDRFNARQRNAAEMAALEQDAPAEELSSTEPSEAVPGNEMEAAPAIELPVQGESPLIVGEQLQEAMPRDPDKE